MTNQSSSQSKKQSHQHGGAPHDHGVSADADRRWLTVALLLIVGFMAAELTVGLIAGSLALISDAGHMLTDAGSIGLALVAIRLARRPARGDYTYGLKRAEILSAQANGITLLLLTGYFAYEGVRRLVTPPEVSGLPVLLTALAGIAVNLAATWCISKANRSSLNVEGAFQHILNDLFAFIATAIAGAVIVLTGFARADAIAALIVAALMAKAGTGLVRASGKVLLEAAPEGVDPESIGRQLAAMPSVVEVHDLHIWEITSDQPALSAHILVSPSAPSHAARADIERLLRNEHQIDHTTLQIEHTSIGQPTDDHCNGCSNARYRGDVP